MSAAARGAAEWGLSSLSRLGFFKLMKSLTICKVTLFNPANDRFRGLKMSFIGVFLTHGMRRSCHDDILSNSVCESERGQIVPSAWMVR